MTDQAPVSRTIVVPADPERATPTLSVDREPRQAVVASEPRLVKPRR